VGGGSTGRAVIGRTGVQLDSRKALASSLDNAAHEARFHLIADRPLYFRFWVEMKEVRKTASDRMNLSNLYQAPGHLIRRLQQIAVGIFLEELKEHDVTPVQYAAMIAISNCPGLDQKSLASQIAVDRSTIGTLLKVLEARGLITRITPNQDKRTKTLFINAKGEWLLQGTLDHTRRVEKQILAPLNTRERKEFMDLLGRLVQSNNKFSRVPLDPVATDD
jgi:DNA-binding MarR family transcriptional regulator